MKARLAKIEECGRVIALLRKNDFVEPGVTDAQLEQLFRSFYVNNPTGREYMVVGEHDAEIAAFHAAIPFAFRALASQRVGGLGSNLVVDRPLRHGLVFLQLQKFFFSNYQERGLDFVYGLVTRQEVLQVHLKTGFKAVGEIPVYARPYRLEKLAARLSTSERVRSALLPIVRSGNGLLRLGFSAPSDISVDAVSRFPSDIDDFVGRNLARFEVCALRNEAILNWRFATLGFRNYEILIARKGGSICGYAVLRLMDMREFKTLAVVDFLSDWETRGASRALLARVHERALAQHVDLVSVIHSTSSPLRSVFRKAGFLRTPESFTLVVNQPRASAAPLGPEHYDSWHVTWFDHDVV